MDSLTRLNYKWLERVFNSLFEFENLPDTMDIDFINWTLNRLGFITLLKAGDGTLRCLQGAISGVDEYNRADRFQSVNPVEKYSGLTRSINKDCVVMYNTRNDRIPENNTRLFRRYAYLLTNIDTSINAAIYNTRVSTIFHVKDEPEAQKVRALIDGIATGKPFTLLKKTTVEELVTGQPPQPLTERVDTGRNSYVLDLLLRDRWTVICNFLTEIGVNNTPFEKAERQITDEVNSNNDLLALSRNEYFAARKKAFDRFNEIFGTNVQVKLNKSAVQDLIKQEGSKSSDMEADL